MQGLGGWCARTRACDSEGQDSECRDTEALVKANAQRERSAVREDTGSYDDALIQLRRGVANETNTLRLRGRS